MNVLQLTIIGLALLALVVSALVVHVMLKRALKKRDKETLLMLWAHAKSQTSATLKVVEADKVLDEALTLLGYSGTLGEKLKQAGPRLGNEDAVWRAHKLRNSLVHDLGRTATDQEAEQAFLDIGNALRHLGM